jgi:hypothetical protein
MCKVKISLSTLISKMLEIEKITGIKLESYYLYDRKTNEKITVQNCEKTFDYFNAYNNRITFKYVFDDELERNPVAFLQKRNGFIYVPICLRNQMKAYIFEFNLQDVNRFYIAQEGVYEQLCLPLKEMLGGVVHA